jgi:hypothetical protein
VTDPNHAADARQAGVAALADALAAELVPFRWFPANLLPRPRIDEIARRQLDAILALPAPTRAALLGAPR